MGRIVGIDLGTTNSLVAYVDAQTGQPKCIPGPYGSTLCPSVVSLDLTAASSLAKPHAAACSPSPSAPSTPSSA